MFSALCISKFIKSILSWVPPIRPIMRRMRAQIAQIALSICCLALVSFCADPATADGNSCPTPQTSTAGELRITQVNFIGSYTIPNRVVEEIAHSIEQQVHGTSVDAVEDEAADVARAGWQDRGYFKVIAESAGATLNAFPPQTVSLTIRVEEGTQYRRAQDSFKNNKAIANTSVLRSLFPIKDGEIFSREKIAKGLQNLWNAYTQLGYINFTSIPNTTFDESKKLIFLDIDVDEGEQFAVLSLDIVGVDQRTREELLREAPLRPGQIYNSRLLRLFIESHPTIFQFAADDPGRLLRRLDGRTGKVAITIDARPCDNN
jgi:hypothetical protein